MAKKSSPPPQPEIQEKKFNLLEEGWISVILNSGDMTEISLMDVFKMAPDIYRLNGETETQNSAMLRLLLAILHRVMTKYDADGEEKPVQDADDAEQRWQTVWEEKKLPVSLIEDYLKEYREAFWLLHPENPFWQTPAAANGTEYGTQKLFGDLSESNNKIRLFQNRSKEGKLYCSLPEAARWLLFLNAYDDTSVKVRDKGDGSPGTGWLGKISQVYVQGENLFETLMLNLPLLKDGREIWPEDKPIWENKHPVMERKKIALPSNFSELMTLQSRRILLHEKDDQITGYNLTGGEYFEPEGAFTEQFSLWKKSKDKKNEISVPRLHDPSRQMWRDFANYLPVSSEENPDAYQEKIPGIVLWIKKLQDDEILPDEFSIGLQTCAVSYIPGQNSGITDMFGDGMRIHTSLLAEGGLVWTNAIFKQIEVCDKLAYAAGELSYEAAAASGASSEPVLNTEKARGKSLMYSSLDQPFKSWLAAINPADKNEDISAKVNEWKNTAKGICLQTENLITEKASQTPDAIFGRSGKKKTAPGKTEDVTYSLSEAVHRYRNRVYRYLKGDE